MLESEQCLQCGTKSYKENVCSEVQRDYKVMMALGKYTEFPLNLGLKTDSYMELTGKCLGCVLCFPCK